MTTATTINAQPVVLATVQQSKDANVSSQALSLTPSLDLSPILAKAPANVKKRLTVYPSSIVGEAGELSPEAQRAHAGQSIKFTPVLSSYPRYELPKEPVRTKEEERRRIEELDRSLVISRFPFGDFAKFNPTAEKSCQSQLDAINALRKTLVETEQEKDYIPSAEELGNTVSWR